MNLTSLHSRHFLKASFLSCPRREAAYYISFQKLENFNKWKHLQKLESFVKTQKCYKVKKGSIIWNFLRIKIATGQSVLRSIPVGALALLLLCYKYKSPGRCCPFQRVQTHSPESRPSPRPPEFPPSWSGASQVPGSPSALDL